MFYKFSRNRLPLFFTLWINLIVFPHNRGIPIIHATNNLRRAPEPWRLHLRSHNIRAIHVRPGSEIFNAGMKADVVTRKGDHKDANTQRAFLSLPRSLYMHRSGLKYRSRSFITEQGFSQLLQFQRGTTYPSSYQSSVSAVHPHQWSAQRCAGSVLPWLLDG